MKKVLIKDIVIPAGTIFTDAPTETHRSSGFGEAIVGLTDDTCGSITYDIDGDDKEKLKEWFVDVIE
jgi:hypothetical protein